MILEIMTRFVGLPHCRSTYAVSPGLL
jgi:hypothetical protein